MVEEVENLTVAEVVNELESGAVTLIDVREEAELIRTGIIPGAWHVPLSELESFANPHNGTGAAELSLDKRLILYCAAGVRSALGVEILQELGYENAANLDGGIVAWKNASQEVVAV